MQIIAGDSEPEEIMIDSSFIKIKMQLSTAGGQRQESSVRALKKGDQHPASFQIFDHRRRHN